MHALNRIIYILFVCFVVLLTLVFADPLKEKIRIISNRGIAELLDTGSIDDNSNEKIKQTQVIIDEQDAVINVVKKVNPAVVSIVEQSVSIDIFDGPRTSEDSIGTGFIIDGQAGLVLTNRHVAGNKQSTYKVILSNSIDQLTVKKVYLDPINDFAILQLDLATYKGDVLPSVELGDSDALLAGQTVVAIGNALGNFSNSVTKGVISGIGREISTSSPFYGEQELVENVIQTDAALNPGNSGGPLLNLTGQVVGINVAIASGSDNIGFSIPINDLKPVIDQFKKTGRIIKPFLGVQYQMVTPEVATQRKLATGAFITGVVEDSPANKVGVQVGDIIKKINGIQLDNKANTLSRVILKSSVDNDTLLLIDRSGKEIELSVQLEDGNL